MKRPYILLVFVPVIALLFMLTESGSAPKDELKFSHPFHVTELGMECADCHADVEESTTGADDLLPSMDTCGDCHDIETEDNCNLCHTDYESAETVRITDYSEKFSHAAHTGAELECADCHGMLLKETDAPKVTLRSVPNMTTCMSCHEQKAASNECASCHLPTDQLKPASHTPNFEHAHSDIALADFEAVSAEMSCQTCHQTEFCQQCHEGDNLERTTHPLNFQFTHALQAMGKERECAVCHTEKEFCESCHRDLQILPHSHTPGWVNRIPNDGGRHRVEALADLESCISCHESNAQQICQTCHNL